MNNGKKRISVVLQRNTPTRSSTGQEVDVWATYATVFASVKDLRGGAYYAAEQTANETVAEVYIHYRSDIEPGDRAIMGGVTYELSAPAVNINMRNKETLLRLRYVE